MNRIFKLGVILFVVLGATNKVLGQEKRKQIPLILIKTKLIVQIPNVLIELSPMKTSIIGIFRLRVFQ